MIRIKIEVAGVPVIFETHDRLHPDEGAACWLIEKFGNKEFLNKYARGGVIRVGVDGGSFDEHPGTGSKRKEGECATTLVAKALGVDRNPALKKIIEFIRSRDLKGGGDPFDIASFAKLMSKNPEKAINWLGMALDEKYQQELHFHKFNDAYEKIAKLEKVRVRGQMLNMVILPCDNEEAMKVAFSRDAAVVLQKKSSGNVQIYTDKAFKIALYDVARMMNLAEQQAAGRVTTTDWEDLAAEGKIPGGRWHFFPEGQMLLNGSLSYPDVPPTRLPLEQIKRIVQIGIDPFYLPQHCRTSRNCIFRRCGWYSWGLQRCQNIRRD